MYRHTVIICLLIAVLIVSLMETLRLRLKLNESREEVKTISDQLIESYRSNSANIIKWNECETRLVKSHGTIVHKFNMHLFIEDAEDQSDREIGFVYLDELK